MNLDDLKRNWEAFGDTDPFWAILTGPSKKNNRWNLNEFFATGEAEVDWPHGRRRRALCVIEAGHRSRFRVRRRPRHAGPLRTFCTL
jgi:hypothetical protein